MSMLYHRGSYVSRLTSREGNDRGASARRSVKSPATPVFFRLTTDDSRLATGDWRLDRDMWSEFRGDTGLLTDLYHLDAAYVSWRAGENAPATFDLYTRSAPFGGTYLLTAGLEPALAFARQFRYTDDDLAYIAHIKAYDPAFLDVLRRLRFTGEILAMPEGT